MKIEIAAFNYKILQTKSGKYKNRNLVCAATDAEALFIKLSNQKGVKDVVRVK
jgi:hypothetical protein